MGRSRWHLVGLWPILWVCACDRIRHIEERAEKVNRYEQATLVLLRKNRVLEAEVSRLEFEVNSLKSQHDYLSAQEESLESKRNVASVTPILGEGKEDLVEFEKYRWNPSQMLAVAEREFDNNNYEKSAQFFYRFSMEYPDDDRINDVFLFQAGIASFESGRRDWALDYMGKLIEYYPKSDFYRGAKLWRGLIYLENGDHDRFFNTVEEFRMKYKNTPEWSILSRHYEEYVLQHNRISL